MIIDWIDSSECDVMVFDADGIETLSYCIPDDVKTNILNVNDGVKLIFSLHFFLSLTKNLLLFKKLKLALVTTIVEHWNPKIIITFIDNASALGNLKIIFPKIHMISVQNGTRWDLSRPGLQKLNFDYYFSFGDVEQDIFRKAGHTVKHFYPVGSVKAGVFDAEIDEKKKKIFDICFISQYRTPPSSFSDPWEENLLTSYAYVTERIVNNINEFAKKNNFKICIALRGADNPNEQEFFKCADKNNITLIPNKGFLSSYNAVRASKLTIALSSTLGLEALGLAEKVIVCKDIEELSNVVMQGLWTENLCTHELKDLQRLHTIDYKEFEYKVSELFKMSPDEYYLYSKNARKYYMNYEPNNPPHQIIKNKIRSLLLEN